MITVSSTFCCYFRIHSRAVVNGFDITRYGIRDCSARWCKTEFKLTKDFPWLAHEGHGECLLKESLEKMVAYPWLQDIIFLFVSVCVVGVGVSVVVCKIMREWMNGFSRDFHFGYVEHDKTNHWQHLGCWGGRGGARVSGQPDSRSSRQARRRLAISEFYCVSWFNKNIKLWHHLRVRCIILSLLFNVAGIYGYQNDSFQIHVTTYLTFQH